MQPNTEEDKLHDLFEDYFQEYLALHPVEASAIGDHRYDDLLVIDISKQYREHLQTVYTSYLNKLKKYKYEDLNTLQKENYDVFQYVLKMDIKHLNYPEHLLPINPYQSLLFSFIEMGSGASWHPFKSVKDYENFLARTAYISSWVDTAIYNMNQGLKTGIVHPRSVIESSLPIITSQVTEDPRKCSFYIPVEKFPDDFREEDKKRLKNEFISAIKNRIVPAFKKLIEYLEVTYLPRTRNTISLSDLPGGKDWYTFLVKYYTTTEMRPEEIFELGISEIQTISEQAKPFLLKLGLSGNIYNDVAELWEQDSFRTQDKKEVFKLFDEIYAKVKSNILKLFNHIPKAHFEIREVEPYRSANSGQAFYNPPSENGDRPGVFYINFINGEYFTLNMEALFMHEAWPGHHFQIAIAQELNNIPNFRKFTYFGAYVEGWGLYAEKLGYDLGLYRDEWQELGMIIADWERASRLIADIGIHYKGWTKLEAIEKLAQFNASGKGEINRYTYIPGQALSYKVGEKKIIQLRDKVQVQLADDFNFRDFHDIVLSSGQLPLNILEDKVIHYLENLKRSLKR